MVRSSWMGGRTTLLLVGALWIGACASFGSSSDPPAATSQPDASKTVLANDSGSKDSGSEGGTTEQEAGPSPPASVCIAPYVVCDDFEAPALDSQWGTRLSPTKDVGTIDLDVSRGHSGTHSIAAMLNAHDDGDVQSRITQTLSSFPAKGTIAAWVFTTDTPTIPYNLIELHWANGNDAVDLDVRATPSGLTVRADGDDIANMESDPGPALPQNEWVQLTVSFDLPNNSFEVAIGGGAAAIHIVLPSGNQFDWNTAIKTELLLGLESADDASAPYHVWFDDVILRAD